MRNHPCATWCLFLLSCAPATDLRQEQASAPVAEATSGQLTSPEPDALAGKLVEPPPGATGIPTNLLALVVRFTEPVQSAGAAPPFLLRSAAGGEQPLQLGASVPCDASCYQVPLASGLEPSALYTLGVVEGGLQFLDGKPVPAGSAGSFAAGAVADLYAPRIEAFTALIVETCLSVHLVADEAVRADLVISAGGQEAVLPGGNFVQATDLAQRLPELPPSLPAQVLARVIDRAGNEASSAPVSFNLPPALPRLVLTEVLANPAGSETTQEFVEIYNAGGETAALGGLVIADKTGSDVLPDAALPPGGFAVIVGEKYDPADGKDIAVRDSAVLVRAAGRIGSDGLANAGEVVSLLAAGGQVISQYGGFVDVSASAWSGKSVKRTSIDACDGLAAWTATPSPATPGW
jgi:hypothetical protein